MLLSARRKVQDDTLTRRSVFDGAVENMILTQEKHIIFHSKRVGFAQDSIRHRS